MTESDNLRGGRVALGVGTIAVHSQVLVRYEISPVGFFAQTAGSACWQLRLAPLQSPQFVSYPFPGEHLDIAGRTRHEVVLQALASNYSELDFVDSRTFLELRQVDETMVRHKLQSSGAGADAR